MDATYRWRLYLFLFGGLHSGGACIRGGLAFGRNVQFFPLIQEMGGLIQGGLNSGGGQFRVVCSLVQSRVFLSLIDEQGANQQRASAIAGVGRLEFSCF